MNRATSDGIILAYEQAGTGDPVLFVHGAFVADAFRPLLSDPELLARFRLIGYHRRGYGASSGGDRLTVAEHAADCRRLLSDLGVARAHVVGHSLGGPIALQLALDAPELVHTIGLLEAALVAGESADAYRQGLEQSRRRHLEAGAAVAVAESFAARWPEYEERLPHALPGALEQAVEDAATAFDSDVPALLAWRFGEGDARRIEQRSLVVLGEKSLALHPRFAEAHQLLLAWLPNAEEFVLPGATHFLQIERPRALAAALADFWAGSPLPG